jgi:MscS family membrane protein
MVAWNLVNLIDAEGSWFLMLLGFFLGTTLVIYTIRHLLVKLHVQFTKNHLVWQDGFIRALFRPLYVLIWFFVALFSIDIVTDNYLFEQIPAYTHLISSLAVVCAMSWFFLRWKKNIVAAYLETCSQSDVGRIVGFGKIASAVIIILSILILLEVSGSSLATISAFGGISGLALAISSQEVLNNFFGGFVIYTNRPFSIGDSIELPSHNLEGTVEDIGWYETRLRGIDRSPIYVPNSLFTKAFVINSSRRGSRKLEEEIAIRHQDLGLAPLIVNDIRAFLEQHEAVDKKERLSVSIAHISPYSVDITVEAVSLLTQKNDFLKFRSEFFLKAGHIVAQHGARLASRTEMAK